MKQQWVILQPGTPQPADFATTGGDGGPVIINTVTKALYYLDAGNAVTALATGGGSGTAFIYTVVPKTASYTETTTTGSIFIMADLAAGFTITLPTAVGNAAQFTIKKMQAAGQITVATTSAQTIDGGATAVLNNLYESITIESNGANWIIT